MAFAKVGNKKRATLRKPLLTFHLQAVIVRISARLLVSKIAPPGEDAARIERPGARRRLVDVPGANQLVRLVADISGFDQKSADLPLDGEIPLLAVGGRKVVWPAVHVEKQVAQIIA